MALVEEGIGERLALSRQRPGEPAENRRAAVRLLSPEEEGRVPVRVIRTLSGLQGLQADWEAISAPWSSPMESFDWVRSWAEVYGIDRDLVIYVVGRAPAVAIAPLVRSQDGGRWLELAGPPTLGEAMDFPHSDSRLVVPLASALAGSGRPLRLWRVPADSPFVPALVSAFRGRGLIRCRPGLACPSLPLDETWGEPEEHLDKRRRSNLRRAQRIAEGMGPVTWEILSPRPGEVGPLLQEAYAVEGAGWKAHSGSPLGRDRMVGEFFRRYATAAAEKGILRICFLRIGGRAVAMKLGTVLGNRFWLLAMGYSGAFERCSPGSLLLRETVRYAAQSGLRSYEFLGADEPWIRPWSRVLRPCVELRAYPLSVPGAVALASDAGAFARLRANLVRARAVRLLHSFERRAARAYVAGSTIEDAADACRALQDHGFRTTIGYMAIEGDAPPAVAGQYSATIDAVRAARLDCYASVKAPVLQFSRTLLRDIAQRARAHDVGLHFDAMGADDVDGTFSLISEILALYERVGCTLPGRWWRSFGDAERAVDLGLGVRVVTGEYPDPVGKGPDPRAGFLAIVDRVAGRVPRVAVATHDPYLARVAIRRLKRAGTPCELEVLLGYPVHRVTPVARAEEVPVRMYVPYGNLSPPYSLSQVWRNPRVAGWAVRDLGALAKLRPLQTAGIPERYARLLGPRVSARPSAR